MMPKQGRQQSPPQGPHTSLLDLWRGDLSEVIAAFLPLKAIATMPLLARRFRDRRPVILFSVARRHCALAAGTGALLDAVVATGREWRRFSSDAVDDDGWTAQKGNAFHDFTCSTITSGGVRHIQISKMTVGHGGGLARSFNPADRLCLRRVKYRFSFTDPTPDASQAEPQFYGFAYFLINNRDGLSVSPTGAEYVLKCRAAQYDVAKYQCVEPDTWYDVEMTYDWGGLGDDHNSLWVDVVLKGEDGSRNRLRHDFKRNPLSNVELYSYSPGVVRYTAIAIW